MALIMLANGVLFTGNLAKAQPTSGVVTIAFDDGTSSQISNAFPLMQQHGFVGTYYIITNNIGAAGCMNISNLQTLQNAGNEIGSHSVDHPSFLGLTDAQINYECNASQQLLQANGFPAMNFAYPYGGSNSHINSIVLQYYRSARNAYGPGFLAPIPPNATQMSTPMGWPGETGNSSALPQDEAVVNQAHATNSWVIIFFHNILTTPLTAQSQITQSDFAAFLNYVASSGVQVMTVNQALNLWSPSYSASIVPSSATLDVGQNQTFNASAALGGSTPYKYQWYLNGSAVGTNSSNYTFNASSVGSFSLYVNVTNSATSLMTIRSNTTSITVNSALVASAVTPAPGTVNQGQNSSLTSSLITTSSSPYTYQWFEKAPGGSYVTVGSNSASFSFATSSATATGNWSFILQVKDNAGEATNSSAVVVTVNTTLLAPVASASPSMIAQGQTSALTSAAVTTGTGPYSYQWFEEPYSGVYATETANTSSFDFVTSSATAAGSWSFILQVIDATGATVNSSVVSVSLNPSISASSSDGGYISPTGNVTVNYGDSQTFNVTAYAGYNLVDVNVDGSSVGIASSYNFSNVEASHIIYAEFAPVPTPMPASAPTSIPTSYPTQAPMPSSTAAPTSIPTPSPKSALTTISGGATVAIEISGNETNLLISNVTIATNQSATSTTVFFTATSESGTTNFNNVTIPKSAVLYGTRPTIYIDSQLAQNQSYTQDTNNYYAWYTTHSNTNKISIVFTTSPNNTSALFQNAIAAPNRIRSQSLTNFPSYAETAAIAIIAIIAAALAIRKKRGRQNLKEKADLANKIIIKKWLSLRVRLIVGVYNNTLRRQ
jgi:peptidoglycan/xylan/chitin deacetylase (PgdA/CDA1 family)